jgi:hypothetical protein
MSRRAELLAARIEEGASGLAAFAEALSDADWGTPTSATDRRTVGQIVNHVALVYPIEVDLARAIASGKAVTDVTWQVVAELNAGHARDHAKVTKGDSFGAPVTAQFVVEDHAVRHSWHHLASIRAALGR